MIETRLVVEHREQLWSLLVEAQQPYDIDEPQPQPAEPLTRQVAELFNLGYEVLLQVLTRFFTHR